MKINQLSRRLIILVLVLIPNIFFGQVGINSTGVAPSADAMLDVKSSNKGVLIPRLSSSALIPSPTLGLIFYNTTTNQFNYYNGTSWIAITNAANATGWSVNGNHIFNSNTGNVGIGTVTPKAPFNVAAGKTVLFGVDSLGYGNKLAWFSTKGAFKVGMTNGGFNYSDIGYISTAMGAFTVASGDASTALGARTIASGEVSTAMGIETIASGEGSIATGKSTTSSGIYSTAMGKDSKAIGVISTAFGFGTFASGQASTAIGAGTIASGDYSSAMGNQTIASGFNSVAMGLSTAASGNYSAAMGILNVDVTNALLMVGNGNGNLRSNALTVMMDGKVGIGTTAPIAPLHIEGSNLLAETNQHYFNWASSNLISTLPNNTSYVGLLVGNDIVTRGTIVSAQAVTTSDGRIKNVICLSNNQQDLAKVRQIQITDYRYKDVHTWGNQTFKKVIAQQVEAVYPQAVRKMTSTIPDIYSLADKVVFDEINNILTVSLSNSYGIKIGEKIEFVLEKQGKIQGVVTSVLGNSFTVKNWQFPTDKIFVFGREVNDFRSVDYEAISMLGISAIQQLAKENEELKNKMKSYESRLEALENLLTKNQTGK